MIDPAHDLPIKQQAEVLGISRSSVYYQARPVSESDLWLMRQIDELHLNYPFAGSRMLRDLLGHQGLEVGKRPVFPSGIAACVRPMMASWLIQWNREGYVASASGVRLRRSGGLPS
jgi:hypothetical protein